jgi:TRAP-type C4-dicarboxylate transport system permease small subunit
MRMYLDMVILVFTLFMCHLSVIWTIEFIIRWYCIFKYGHIIN